MLTEPVTIKSFDPIAHESCTVLILGTMPGVESLRRQEYYGNERNKFWQILLSLFGQDEIYDYNEKIDFLLKNHIAIWDVLECCDRDGSSDTTIKNPKANDFKGLFMQYPNLKSVCFNGKTAEALYLKLVGKDICDDIIYQTALPSTSPAYAIKFEKKVREWRRILSSLNGIINSNIIKVSAYIGGYSGSSYAVDIDFIDGVADYKYMEYGLIPTTEKRIVLNNDSVIKFVESLHNNKVFGWKSSYEPEYPICDGTSWNVSIITKEENYLFQGNNEYPMQWKKFCRSIKTLIGEEFS